MHTPSSKFDFVGTTCFVCVCVCGAEYEILVNKEVLRNWNLLQIIQSGPT